MMEELNRGPNNKGFFGDPKMAIQRGPPLNSFE